MKISISLVDDDIAFLDQEAEIYGSRSAAISAAIRSLRERLMVDAYRESFAEWAESGDSEAWDRAADDVA